MSDTLLLDIAAWDLVLTVAGNIAVASAPYALAQDAASAIKTFQSEVYYDTTLGVPYWTSILGTLPPLALIKAKFVAAALTVPGVVSAQVFITSIVDRTLNGQVQIVDTNGNTAAAAF